MTRRFAYLLIWIALNAEIEGHIFHGEWSTPLTPISSFFFKPIAHIIPWDALVVLTLLIAARGAGWSRVKPIVRSIGVSVLALIGCWLWGMVTGGSAYQTIFQLRPFVFGLFITLLVLATCKTVAHIETLLGVIAFATVYRCIVLILFYVLVAQHMK